VKITAIRAFPIWVGDRNQLLVKVETDSGIFGWGESGLASRERAVMGAIEHYARILVGRSPMEIAGLWQEMYRSQYFEGGRVLTAAISAIDIALYDIKGKALSVPVYELLGGKCRDRIPTFASVKASDPKTMIERARKVREAGWTCMRLGRAEPSPDAPTRFDPWRSLTMTAGWMTECRAELGIDVVLGIDWHHRLSVAEAASFCQRMPAGTLDFVEEPIRDESPDAYAALRSMTPIPFAIGEEFSSKWQFLPYVERGLTQYARVDICNVGGFTEAMKVAGWCEAHYIDLMPHNPLGPVCTAASIHLGAAVPNFSWLECRTSPGEETGRHISDVFLRQPVLDGANYPLPTGPGLGIEIAEDMLPRPEDFRFYQMPQFRRPDGSHTNW
jgi:galactonate dehydratase